MPSLALRSVLLGCLLLGCDTKRTGRHDDVTSIVAGWSHAEPAVAGFETKVESKSGMTFVHLPAGSFMFGCSAEDKYCANNEKPARNVEMPSYWLMSAPVTVAAYIRCIERSQCDSGRRGMRRWNHYDSPGRGARPCNLGEGRMDYPMNCLTWDDATRFCAWLGTSLTSSEEWEYAARRGDGRIYPFADTITPAAIAQLISASHLTDGKQLPTLSVKALPRINSAWGITAMFGVCREWTATAAPGQQMKEVRGCTDCSLAELRTSHKEALFYDEDVPDVGFRCSLQDERPY